MQLALNAEIAAKRQLMEVRVSNRRLYDWADSHPDRPFPAVTRTGNFLFISGQVGMDRITRDVVQGGIRPQTTRALENISEALKLAGASLENLVKLNVFLVDMRDLDDFNDVYREFFPTNSPSRTTVGISGLSTPELLIEIDAIAATV